MDLMCLWVGEALASVLVVVTYVTVAFIRLSK